MSVLFHSSPSIFFTPTCSFKPKTPSFSSSSKPPLSITATIPAARDRVIDFGKYKGRMLGTLPARYLKWVSKNLRARDFEEWAKLADHVLQDPVYQDRIEWELAQNVLNGNSSSSSSSGNLSAVAELLEISERFGWDNNDKVGWSRVNFELLGTSKGGRIPRLCKDGGKKEMGKEMGRKVEVFPEGGEKRRERRERLRVRREVGKEGKLGIVENDGGVVRNSGIGEEKEEVRYKRDNEDDKDGMVENWKNPFPGREALLKKVLFDRMASLLSDAEEKQIRNQAVKEWLNEIEDASSMWMISWMRLQLMLCNSSWKLNLELALVR
ncbi:uncharacterized protein LOC107428220 isoform X3 [Ziziphus jujuba]|uniref:Uncharacterized protein LOC107428220 isoform X3 n=1 Tax=Ziziphus jujuba TaxID=326968 RepID=A0ABM3ZXZ8_ZIZJJ|nr:uncharacterized protein LOC107428220 isoform X3 [Ziziphus jujuba]